MKVSIIIPSYNQAQYLPEAIESALNQTVPCEIIVIDDGSTDNSLQIAKSYEYKGVIVVSQVNKGLASARNTGIMWATGDYILPLDADDILLPNCVERIIKIAETSKSDIIAPSFHTFGTSQEQVIIMSNPTIADFRIANRIGYFSAVKKQAFLDVGGYSPRMAEGYEDYHLWFNLLTRGKTITTIPEALVLYRTKEHSMIKSAVKYHAKLMGQIFKDFPQILPKEIVPKEKKQTA